MNPLLPWMTGGGSLFVGLGLSCGAALLRLRKRGRLANGLTAAIWILGVGLVLLSAAPLPFWLYGLWLGLGIVLQAAVDSPIPSRWKIGWAAGFVALALVLGGLELTHRFSPRISLDARHPIYVVGDSLSSGIRRGERPWPKVLGDRLRIEVVNLARPGASTATALNQAPGIVDPEALVLIEIGGNDLIGGTDPGVFHADLDRLLGQIARGNHRLAMFELPLFPLSNRFGLAQRELARKYGVRLIPKGVLVDVLRAPGATLDGLHLSQQGHDALAARIAGLLKAE